MDIKSNKKLDYTLNFLKQNKRLPTTIYGVHIQIKDYCKIPNEDETYTILQKLQKDNFVHTDFKVVTNIESPLLGAQNTEDKYSITFEGVVFFENGGYTRQAFAKNIRFIIDSLQVFAIISGGVFASIYYILEIFK